MPLTERVEVRVRPTLVVGLGGRGCRTVTDMIVKLEELLGGPGAELPPFLQILGIDSTWDPREHYKIGEGRFVHIKTGGLGRLRESIVRGGRPALGAWFDATMDVPQLNGTGLAGNRHLGALSFAANCQLIYDRLSSALDALVEADLQEKTINWQQEHGHETRFIIDRAYPQVLLISSTCGGTGAGLLLDVAALVAAHAERTGGQSTEVTTTAFIYLPDTWDQVTEPLRRQWYINTYAMLMEIDAVHSGRPHLRFRRLLGAWGPEMSSELELKSSPFAGVYLINGHGTEHGSHFPEQLIIDRVSSFIASLVMQPGGSLVRNDQINFAQASLSGDETLNYLGLGYSEMNLSVEEARRLVAEELYRRALTFVGGKDESSAPADLVTSLGWGDIPRGPSPAQLDKPDLFNNVKANRGIIQRTWAQHRNQIAQQVNVAVSELTAGQVAQRAEDAARQLIAQAVAQDGFLGGVQTARAIADGLRRIRDEWQQRSQRAATERDTSLRQAQDRYGNAMAATTAPDQEQLASAAWAQLNEHMRAQAEEQWFAQAAQMAEDLQQTVRQWADRLQDAATWSAAQARAAAEPVVSRLLPIAWDEFAAACTAGGGASEERRLLQVLADKVFGPGGLVDGAHVGTVIRDAASTVVGSVEWSVRHRLKGAGTGTPLLSDLYQEAEPMIEHDTVQYSASEMARAIELEGVADKEVMSPPYAATVRNSPDALVPERVAVLSLVGRFPLRGIARLDDWKQRYWNAQRRRDELLRTAGHSGVNPHSGIFWWLPDLFEPDETDYPQAASSILAMAVALGALRLREELGRVAYWEWAEAGDDHAFTIEDMLLGAAAEGGEEVVQATARRIRQDTETQAVLERMGSVALRLVTALPPNWPRRILRQSNVLFRELAGADDARQAMKHRVQSALDRLDSELADEPIGRNQRLIKAIRAVLEQCLAELDRHHTG